jgi:hypothetical protein
MGHFSTRDGGKNREEPHRYPEGIPHVVVNGAPAILNGPFTGARPGRVLKKSGD